MYDNLGDSKKNVSIDGPVAAKYMVSPIYSVPAAGQTSHLVWKSVQTFAADGPNGIAICLPICHLPTGTGE